MIEMVAISPAHEVYKLIVGESDFKNAIDNERIPETQDVFVQVYSIYNLQYSVYIYFVIGDEPGLTISSGNINKDSWELFYNKYNILTNNKGKFRFRGGHV